MQLAERLKRLKLLGSAWRVTAAKSTQHHRAKTERRGRSTPRRACFAARLAAPTCDPASSHKLPQGLSECPLSVAQVQHVLQMDDFLKNGSLGGVKKDPKADEAKAEEAEGALKFV